MTIYGAHVPVLLSEVLSALSLQPGAIVVDGTLGAGGYTAALLEQLNGTGKVIAFDLDKEAITNAEQRFRQEIQQGRLQLEHRNMSKLADALGESNIAGIDACVMDLGLSSHQLDTPERGFLYRKDAKLDMRFNAEDATVPTAAELVNYMDEQELKKIFSAYGEVKEAGLLAKRIVQMRQEEPIQTTTQLATIALGAKRSLERDETFLAKVFQALRIAVNDELTVLKTALQAAINALNPNGVLAVVSYHSLEDRIVKQTLLSLSKERDAYPDQPSSTERIQPILQLLTKKPITPLEEEIASNSRARSAKLRIAKKRAPHSSSSINSS